MSQDSIVSVGICRKASVSGVWIPNILPSLTLLNTFHAFKPELIHFISGLLEDVNIVTLQDNFIFAAFGEERRGEGRSGGEGRGKKRRREDWREREEVKEREEGKKEFM